MMTKMTDLKGERVSGLKDATNDSQQTEDKTNIISTGRTLLLLEATLCEELTQPT